MSRQRTAPRTPHPFVDIPIEHAIEGVSAGGGQAAADHRRQHQRERRDSAGGEKHRRHGSHQEKLDDARFSKPEVRHGNVVYAGELTAATNSLHPEIDAGCTPAYVNLVGGHPIWHVDARHKLYSLTISRARSMAV